MVEAMTTVRGAKKLPPLTEEQFLQQVTQLAELYGWSWAHWRPARTNKGWRTPVSGPLGAGWPDLVLVRAKRTPTPGYGMPLVTYPKQLIFAELKSDSGKVSPQQENVLAILGGVGMVYVWRPADFDRIMDILR